MALIHDSARSLGKINQLIFFCFSQLFIPFSLTHNPTFMTAPPTTLLPLWYIDDIRVQRSDRSFMPRPSHSSRNSVCFSQQNGMVMKAADRRGRKWRRQLPRKILVNVPGISETKAIWDQFTSFLPRSENDEKAGNKWGKTGPIIALFPVTFLVGLYHVISTFTKAMGERTLVPFYVEFRCR